LVAKNNELSIEINKFKNDIDQTNKDNQAYIALERKYGILIREVRNLEGELADQNLALDKQRTGTRIEDVLTMYEHIKYQNEKQKAILDELFVERKQQEEKMMNLENEINVINAATEQRLIELDSNQRQEHEELTYENNQLIIEIQQNRQSIEEVNIQLIQADNRLRNDSNRQRARQLKDEYQTLHRKQEDL